MPGMDGTGPMGTGRRGRGQGPCGRGQGRGQGRGRSQGADSGPGRRNGPGRILVQSYEGSEELADRAALQEQIRLLENDLQAVRQQLDALGPATKEE